MLHLPAIVLLATLWPAVSPHAGDTVEKRYRLPGQGYLQMRVPAAWDDELQQAPDALPPTIEFRARQGRPFAVLVTPMWRVRDDLPPATRDSIRRSVEQAAEAAKSQAVERALNLVEFSGSSGPGFYFSATDSAPKPDEYRYMTQGMVKVSDLLVSFTILTNDGQAQVTRDALAAIMGAAHIASRQRKEPAGRDGRDTRHPSHPGTRI